MIFPKLLKDMVILSFFSETKTYSFHPDIK